MITENSLSLLTENWDNLTDRQYRDAAKGIGRIDRNGDYHEKKEVTAKVLKRQKAGERRTAESNLALSAFKNMEQSIIRAANSVYAGKNNIAKIELDPDAKKEWSSKVETSYSGKGYTVDPLYLHALVTDTNGGKAHIQVDSRPSLSKSIRVNKEDNCSIDEDKLYKIGNTIVSFIHNKIRVNHKNSERYRKEKEARIASHHRNSSYPQGYSKGAAYELRRREYLGEDVLEEGSIADAKQKLYHKDIIEQLRQKGWEPVNSDSDKKYNRDSGNFESYNYVQFRPINRRYIKGSEEERVELNLRTGKCKLMAMMRNQPEYEEPKTYKFDLPSDVKKLGAQLRHSMQANFRSAGKAWEGGGIGTPTKNRTEEMLRIAGEKGANSPILKKILADLDKKEDDVFNKIKAAKENGASEEEIEKLRDERRKISNKMTRYGGLFSKYDNIYKTMMKNGLKNDAEVDKRIALANSGKKLEESVVTEGSHHTKYPPAINYKNVNGYIIKARKALKAGNYDEAEKWAWEAQETMHEDEMQGPGVAATKNAYDIYKKQVMNIYDAVRKAKGNK